MYLYDNLKYSTNNCFYILLNFEKYVYLLTESWFFNYKLNYYFKFDVKQSRTSGYEKHNDENSIKKNFKTKNSLSPLLFAGWYFSNLDNNISQLYL